MSKNKELINIKKADIVKSDPNSFLPSLSDNKPVLVKYIDKRIVKVEKNPDNRKFFFTKKEDNSNTDNSYTDNRVFNTTINKEDEDDNNLFSIIFNFFSVCFMIVIKLVSFFFNVLSFDNNAEKKKKRYSIFWYLSKGGREKIRRIKNPMMYKRKTGGGVI